MRTENDFVFMIAFIESRTGLFNKKDFYAIRVKNRNQKIKNPSNYARISISSNGFDEATLKAKSDFIFSELKKIELNPRKEGKRFLVEIPKKPVPTIDEVPARKETSAVEAIEVYQKKFDELKELHKKLPIFGIANRDQPDVGKGVAYFNYFNEEETEKALKLFSEIGFGVEKRKERECNLTFILMLDSIDTSNLPFGRGKLNGKTLNIFLWIIKKIYRKVVESLPEGAVPGISGRGVLECGEPEIFEIKTELEDQFGITMIIQMSAKKRSEFFILTSSESKEIYDRFNGKINSCDLIRILKNPETEKEIKEKYELKPEPMEKEKTLSIKVAEILRADGFVLSQDRRGSEVCPQLRHHGADFVKISALGGTLKQKQALIKKVKEYLIRLKDVMMTDNGGIETSMTVSIPGLKNTPRKKRKDAKAPPLTEKPEATPAQPAIESLSSPSSDEEKLRASLDDMNIKEEVKKQIRQYFLDKEAAEKIKKANDEVLEILNRLQKKL